MLTGRLPYSADVPKARTKAHQRMLRYRSALDENRDIPTWIDGALRKAVALDPARRYNELSAPASYPSDSGLDNSPMAGVKD
jgi:hypothetical protein